MKNPPPQIYGGPWDGAEVPKDWQSERVETTFSNKSGNLALYLRGKSGNYYFDRMVEPEKAK